ncbi:hypothetical protein T484DRAFT_3630880 [Baffinella frigidus]|nr:hypothetical protein T484DRAFT_3630880 [Cryptophyta sp. CCMP2293]
MVQDGGGAARRRAPSLSARLLGASLAVTALMLTFTALALNGGVPRTPWDDAGSEPAELESRYGSGVGLGGSHSVAAGQPQRLEELDAAALGPEWRQELDEDDDADSPDGDADSDSDSSSGDSARTTRQKAHLISKARPLTPSLGTRVSVGKLNLDI